MRNIFISTFTILHLFAFEFRESKEYLTPTKEELEGVRVMFKSIFQNQNFKLPNRFKLNRVREYLILTHSNSLYLFKESSNSNLILQIPHGFFDLHTRDIGFKLFKEGSFRALATNRVHRDKQDLAHTQKSIFNSFSSATSKYAKVIQLHGFSTKNRKTLKAKESEIILSSSSKEPTESLRALDSCFKNFALSRLYSVEVQELGALTNLNAPNIKGDFIHIELNRDIRERLIKEIDLREKFLECLEQLDS